jgi:hypothetical protein|nr:MAG TPA: hypothetical protein [Caudoviricetes sp.]
MGRLKVYSEKLNHKKIVQKKKDSGRCYNFVEGLGWNHYTKGFRKHSTKVDVMERGTSFLFSLLERVMPKKETKLEVKGE